MKIADSHTHIFPGKIAEKASQAIGDFYNLPMYSDASSASLLQTGARIHTDHFVVCTSATTPKQVTSINDFIAEECRLHPEFTGLCAMHPNFENYEEELDRALSLGLKGVKFHPDFQKFLIDDEKVFPLYRAIAKRGMPILVHAGDRRFSYTHPHRILNVIRRVPDLVVVAAHLGGYSQWEEAMDLPCCENVYVDTSSSLCMIDRDLGMRLIEHFSIPQVMFGTDFPMWEPKAQLDVLLSMPLSEEEKKQILYDNCAKLYGF